MTKKRYRHAFAEAAEEILRLRAQLQREQARCPRCGEAIARHWRNFEGVDALTRAIRALRLARRGG
jgi:uncharacterized protein with PIN domain